MRRLLAAILLFAGFCPTPGLSQAASPQPAASAPAPSEPILATIFLQKKPWDVGLMAGGGIALSHRVNLGLPGEANANLNFITAGLHVGKIVSGSSGNGLFSGQLEIAGEFLPLWIARYPQQTLKATDQNGAVTNQPLSYSVGGASLTPFLVRWNFVGGQRIIPWAQGGVGFIWTGDNFPYSYSKTARTSYTPQFGGGAHVFVKPHQSVDLFVNGVDVINANPNRFDPGVNMTVQFGVGYTWWK